MGAARVLREIFDRERTRALGVAAPLLEPHEAAVCFLRVCALGHRELVEPRGFVRHVRIRQAAEDRSVREDVDPDAMAMVVVGMLRGVALQLMLEPEVATPATRAAVLDHLTRMLAT